MPDAFRSVVRGAGVCGLVALALTAGLSVGARAAAPDRPRSAPPAPATPVTEPGTPDDLREIPGQRLYSRRIVVRPRTAPDLQRLGLDPKAAAALEAATRAALDAAALRHRTETDEYHLAVPKGVADAAYCLQWLGGGAVRYAEPDWIVFNTAAPNDPQFAQQWHHVNIESAQAWDVTTGSPSVVVAIVDTGCELNHPDLESGYVPGVRFVDTADPQATGGDVSPTGSHGTMCAGTAAARGNNGVGVAGVGWALSIMPVRCTDQGSTAQLSDITGGALWAAQHGAKAVSCSWSGVQSATVQSTGEAVAGYNASLCWAAGNSSVNHASFDFTKVVICAATDQSDGRSGFSSFGRAVDVAAPGSGIRTTTTGADYASVSGTSFSTPMTAATLAMIHSAKPTMTAARARAILRANADDLGPPGRDGTYGFGRINLRRAVQAALTDDGAPLLRDDAFVVQAGQPAWLDVLANDPSGDDVLGPGLSGASPTAAGATLVLESSPYGTDRGVVRYVAPAGFVGTDTFSYTLTSAGQTRTATVTIDVRAAGIAAAPDDYTVLQNTAKVLDVLANDGPAENGAIIQFELPSGTANQGSVSREAATSPGGRDQIRYVPQYGYAGPDSFTYTLIDPVGRRASALVTITVQQALPTPQSDQAYTPAGQAVEIDVLGNDTHPLNLSMTIDNYESATQQGGSVQLLPGAGPNGRDALRYTPPAGYTGADAFGYSVRDSSGRTAPSTVAVGVEPLSAYRPAEGFFFSEQGVRAAFYALNNPSSLPDFFALSPLFTLSYPDINFTSTGGNFPGTGLSENFGVVFTGYLKVPVTAAYTISTESDDGSRLLIDGQVIVSNDGLHGMQTRSGIARLRAGNHPVRVELFERGGGVGLIVRLRANADADAVVDPLQWSWKRAAADLVGQSTLAPPADGLITGADFDYFIQAFFSGNLAADLCRAGSGTPPPDGFLTGEDFDYFIQSFFTGQ
ncbi:MAG: S8 family serine peptidase [Phycisphaeraceae bacterium]|nr:S8 family serine peptidase [Phycisphaeraceae bacterium]